MERQYPDFYAFVGSHTDGRYSSLAKDLSDEHNSQEEDTTWWMNWEYLRTAKGVYKNICAAGEWAEEVERYQKPALTRRDAIVQSSCPWTSVVG